MPELPEVEHSRRVWDFGLGQKILKVLVPHPNVRDFRGTEVRSLPKLLTGQVFSSSQANGKQIVFRFGQAGWLGIHLGMSGRLTVDSASVEPRKHDHLILRQAKRSLVFSDQRQFGRVLFHQGIEAPDWWTRLAPPILSDQFTVKAVSNFLLRRRGTPLKAVLQMQERFPGVGNWMADEILWRARINPATKAGELAPAAAADLWQCSPTSRRRIQLRRQIQCHHSGYLSSHRLLNDPTRPTLLDILLGCRDLERRLTGRRSSRTQELENSRTLEWERQR